MECFAAGECVRQLGRSDPTGPPPSESVPAGLQICEVAPATIRPWNALQPANAFGSSADLTPRDPHHRNQSPTTARYGLGHRHARRPSSPTEHPDHGTRKLSGKRNESQYGHPIPQRPGTAWAIGTPGGQAALPNTQITAPGSSAARPRLPGCGRGGSAADPAMAIQRWSMSSAAPIPPIRYGDFGALRDPVCPVAAAAAQPLIRRWPSSAGR